MRLFSTTKQAASTPWALAALLGSSLWLSSVAVQACNNPETHSMSTPSQHRQNVVESDHRRPATTVAGASVSASSSASASSSSSTGSQGDCKAEARASAEASNGTRHKQDYASDQQSGDGGCEARAESSATIGPGDADSNRRDEE